jgi:hypothetical protein
MNEHIAERLVSPTRSSASDTQTGNEQTRLTRIFFLGAILAAELSWLGALAYAGFRLL